MNLRAHWQFYRSIFPFCASFGFVAKLAVGLFGGFQVYETMVLMFGFQGFNSFRKGEIYFYYNLGLTKWQLYRTSFMLNLIIGIPLFCVLMLFKSLFFGIA